MEMSVAETTASKRQVWNAGRSVGANRALKPKQIWEIQFYLNERRRLRDRALSDLVIDSKLRGCDLVRMKIGDIVSGGQIRTRALVMQQNTGRPVQFEPMPDVRASLLAWLELRGGTVNAVNREQRQASPQSLTLRNAECPGFGGELPRYGALKHECNV